MTVVAFFLLRKRRTTKNATQGVDHNEYCSDPQKYQSGAANPLDIHMGFMWDGGVKGSTSPQELSSDTAIGYELDSAVARHEMSSESKPR